MRGQVLFVALLAIVAVAAADVEAEADKPKAAGAGAGAEKPKTFKPQMHRKGELRPGHVAPFPGGYNAAHWRPPTWRSGGVAPTTEQLLKRFPGADRRVPVRVPSAERSPSGYDWETPEYEFEYAARTGEHLSGAAARRSRRARQNLPVIHYPRRGAKPFEPRRARRARTPRPEGAGKRSRKANTQQRKPKAKANAKAKATAAAAKKPTRTAEQRLERLEKVMTFALRQLKRNLKRSKRLETFAKKSKKAISLIARALSGDEKQQKLSAEHIELLRTAALKTQTQVENLHARSKMLAAMSKKHRAAIQQIAREVVSTQNGQNVIVDNVNALRASAKATEKALKNLDARNKASITMLAAHAKKIVKNEKQVVAQTRAAAATEFNVKALHKAAVNAQKAILNLDARQVKATRAQKKEKKALKLAFGAIKQLANNKAKAKANAKPNAKANAKPNAKANAKAKAKKF